VLVLDDAPIGWRSEPDEPADPDEENPLAGTDCDLPVDADGNPLGTIASYTGEALQSPILGVEINSSASVFTSANVAKQTFERFRTLFSRCAEKLEDVGKTQAAKDGEAYDSLEIEDLPLERIGDDSFAVRYEGRFAGRNLVVDFVWIRDGYLMAVMATGGAQAWDDERTRFLGILSDRVAAADDMLNSIR
jgi:hypothetical protein